jgi:predicted TIM-barrel fold metal-dependent hydrolase
MLEGNFVYDADSHVAFEPEQVFDLPPEFMVRRVRAVDVHDAGDLGWGDTSYLWEGRLIPAIYGTGANPGHFPRQRAIVEAKTVGEENPFFGMSWPAQTLSDPAERIRENERRGIDRAVIFPTTVFALASDDPLVEAMFFRSYNRYIASRTAADKSRLRWAGLLPLRHQNEAFAAIEEMMRLGASAALTFGTARDRFLHDSSFTAIFHELERVGLPLAIHAGQCFAPLQRFSDNQYRAHTIGFPLHAQLAFGSLIAGGIYDRHPQLKVALLEFGAEWMLYLVERGDKYRDLTLGGTFTTPVPAHAVIDYTRSDRFFISGEAEDKLLLSELELVSDDGFLYSSDLPHEEGRDSAAEIILRRADLTSDQKRKILGDNAARFYREP